MNNFPLKDVSINEYRFYLLEEAKDTQEQINKKEKLFLEILDSEVKKLGGWDNTRQKNKPTTFREKGRDLLLAITKSEDGSDWIKDSQSKFARKIISRSLLDICYLQSAVAKLRITALEDLENTVKELVALDFIEGEDNKSLINCSLSVEFPAAELRNKEKNKNSDLILRDSCARNFIGTCIFIELETETANVPKREIFEQAFAGLGYKDTQFNEIDFPFAGLAILEDIYHLVWVIIANDVTSATEISDIFLPNYFLSIAKIINEDFAVKDDLEQAKSKRNDLENFINTNLSISVPTLDGMEKTVKQLSDLRTELAVRISYIQPHLLTIKINIGNAEKLLDRSVLFDKHKETLASLLIRPLKLKQEQIETDLSYLDVTMIRSNFISEKYKDITQIRTSVWSRRITVLFGLLALLGVLQLFPEFQTLQVTDFCKFLIRVIILILLAILFVIIAFNFKSRNSE